MMRRWACQTPPGSGPPPTPHLPCSPLTRVFPLRGSSPWRLSMLPRTLICGVFSNVSVLLPELRGWSLVTSTSQLEKTFPRSRHFHPSRKLLVSESLHEAMGSQLLDPGFGSQPGT